MRKDRKLLGSETESAINNIKLFRNVIALSLFCPEVTEKLHIL